MLARVANNVLGAVKVQSLATAGSTGEQFFVVRADNADELPEQQRVHVTEVTGVSENGCRLLDAVAREAFVNIDPSPGALHVLSSPAGKWYMTKPQTMLLYPKLTSFVSVLCCNRKWQNNIKHPVSSKCSAKEW